VGLKTGIRGRIENAGVKKIVKSVLLRDVQKNKHIKLVLF